MFFIQKKRHNLNLDANWTKTKRARYKMCIMKGVSAYESLVTLRLVVRAYNENKEKKNTL